MNSSNTENRDSIGSNNPNGTLPGEIPDKKSQEIPAESMYIRCRICGNFTPGNDIVYKYYCSKECATRFSRCYHCGNYYPASLIPPENDDPGIQPGFCSDECRQLYGPEKKEKTGVLHESHFPRTSGSG